MNDPIRFYSINEPYGEFSNFAAYPIELDNHVWPTSEHFFQAQKFTNRAYQKTIRGTPSPMTAARLGRSRKVPIRTDWNKVRDDVMYRAVRAKFAQHADLQSLLRSTGERKLIEHTQNDSYWGDGGDGSGENMLGQILMRVRKEMG